MIDIGTGVSTAKDDFSAIEEAVRIAKSKKVNKEKIDLAIIFNSTSSPTPAIIKNLSILLARVPLIGGTTGGFFSEQGIFKHGIVVMLITFPEGVYFTTASIPGISTGNAVASGESMGEKLLFGFKNVPRSLGLLFFDKLTENCNGFISGLQEKLGRSFPCIGAALITPDKNDQGRLFFNDGAVSDACAGILFGGKLSFGIGLRHGWKPLGKPHTITSTSDNIIHKIDDQPAIQLYEEYLSYDFPRLKKEFKTLSTLYPIGIRIPGQNEYLLRSIVDIKNDGSLVCHGQVPPNSVTRLMISTKETCLEATKEAIDEAKAQLESHAVKFHKEKTSRMVIVFSSMPRALSLGKGTMTEWQLIKGAFGPETSIIGINTLSELAPLMSSSYMGQAYFQNQMISFLIIEG